MGDSVTRPIRNSKCNGTRTSADLRGHLHLRQVQVKHRKISVFVRVYPRFPCPVLVCFHARRNPEPAQALCCDRRECRSRQAHPIRSDSHLHIVYSFTLAPGARAGVRGFSFVDGFSSTDTPAKAQNPLPKNKDSQALETSEVCKVEFDQSAIYPATAAI